MRMLKAAGVDLTKSDPMEATFELFRKTLDEMEETWRNLRGASGR